MTAITLQYNQPGKIYNPFWRKCIAAGRAAEGLRDDWRQQLIDVQREIGFEYIRFHGIFHDDMMIYREENEKPIYNYQYLDNLFDFLLSVGLRPLLELSFMPAALASGDGTVFWWKGNCTPPKDYNRWAELVSNTVCHCINRYGIDEVLEWYFEVWNEPNLYKGFWYADQAAYFKLYKVTAEAIKSIDSRLRVGGPASSDSGGVKAPWVDEFIAFCTEEHIPVDFISTHPYPNNWPLDGYGNNIMAYRDPDSTLVDMQKIRTTVDSSNFPQAEIHLTEWNSSPSPRDLVHDTAFMAPFIIQNNLHCIGLVDSLAFWTFSDVFEEGRAGDTFFHGGFGLINTQGIKKASYYGYWFLARLGGEVITSGEDYFVCRNGDTLQVLMWNYAHYNTAFGKGDRTVLTELDRYQIFEAKGDSHFELKVNNLTGRYKMTDFTFDRQYGSAFDAWVELGAPNDLTEEEIDYLKRHCGPGIHITMFEDPGQIDCHTTIPAHGVRLVEIQKMY